MRVSRFFYIYNMYLSFTKLLFCLALLVLVSCSSVEKREVVRADHDTNRNIPAIDEMIVTHKKEYIERCYMPVLKRIASNSPRPCETRLQQALERRNLLDFTQENVDIAADELFFMDMQDLIAKKAKEDRNLSKEISRKFRTSSKMMAYYKSKYSFRKSED